MFVPRGSFSLASWARRAWCRLGSGTPRRRKRCTPSADLRLECLEDRTLLSTWVSRGPAPIVNGQTPGSDPVSGRVTALAGDPFDPNTLYLAAAGGGVWQTTDAGNTWLPLTDAQATLFMGALAVAPSAPNILYAGTGEADNSRDSYYGRGVLKSTDSGATWTLLGNAQFDRKTIAKIVVSPHDPNLVYVAVAGGGINGTSGNTGIWHSTDGGASWINTTASLSTTDAYTDLVMDPLDPATLYAAVGSRNGSVVNGIYKTTDGGTTWALAGNVPHGMSNGNSKLALAPSNDFVLYAALTNPVTGSLYKLVKSTDGGVSWTELSSVPNYLGAQGWYDSSLAVDPLNPDTVYAGGQRSILRSFDGGLSWSDISVGSDGHGPHVDHHAIAFDAAGRLLEGDDGGIWRLNNQEPVRWADLNSNLQITQFNGIALHPTNPNVAYGGSQDNGTSKLTGGFAWTLADAGDGGFVRLDFTNPRTVYHSYFFSGNGFLQRSDNGGASWTGKTTGINPQDHANFYPPFIMDPSNAARLLLGTDRVYETTNRADSWTALSAPDTNGWVGGNPIDALAVAPTDGNTIYVAAGGNIFVTTDDGATWMQRNISGNPHIADLEVDPTNSQIAYAVRDQFGVRHVFRTADGGVTWFDISGNLPNLPVYTLVVSGGTLYLGNDDGVYCSMDQGATWSRLGDGLPHTQVHQLVLNPTLQILAAGTYGRGLWELSLGGASHLGLTITANPVVAGVVVQITVTALDSLNNVVPDYLGTVHFTSSDSSALLPDDTLLTPTDVGIRTLTITLFQAGRQTVTVTDLNAGVSGSITLSVMPAAADHLYLTAPDTVVSGMSFDVTVSVFDAFNNLIQTYVGTVQFSTTDDDPGVLLPPDYTFTSADAGMHTFAAGVTLITAGMQTVEADDFILGLSGAAVVNVVSSSPPEGGGGNRLGRSEGPGPRPPSRDDGIPGFLHFVPLVRPVAAPPQAPAELTHPTDPFEARRLVERAPIGSRSRAWKWFPIEERTLLPEDLPI